MAGDRGARRREKKAAAARMEKAHGAWDAAISVIDEARKKQMQPPRACRNPRRRRSPPWTASGTGLSPTATTR